VPPLGVTSHRFDHWTNGKICTPTGVVLSSGVLGVKEGGGCRRLPRVKTLFGGNMWAIRPQTSSEVLSCWDIPEKLGVLAGTDERMKDVFEDLVTPMKIRQSVLESLEPVDGPVTNAASWEKAYVSHQQ
jgi:hypothetical protein